VSFTRELDFLLSLIGVRHESVSPAERESYNRAAAKSLEIRKTAKPATPVERLIGAVSGQETIRNQTGSVGL
jgi:hypothetical protein